MRRNYIPTDHLRARIGYNPDTGMLTWRIREVTPSENSRIINSWNTRYAGKPALQYSDHLGYRRGSLEGVMLLAHRTAWAIYFGRWPVELIDHINGDPSDNRIANLREVSPRGNCQNQCVRAKSSTGIIGVGRHSTSNKFVAQIGNNGSVEYLGIYANIDDAITARRIAERKYGFHPNHGRVA